jgi:hypothetical protein
LESKTMRAAALDFFIWGSGHAFLGYKKVLGLPWIVWSFLLAVFLILRADYARNLYYVTPNFQVAYNFGADIASVIIPYLIFGGLMLYDLIKKGALPAVGPIKAAVVAPAAQTAQVAQPTGGMVCPTCGVPVTAADVFCPSCGTRLQAAAPAMPAPVAAGGAKVCNSCGTANPAGFTFCKRCGNKLT